MREAAAARAQEGGGEMTDSDLHLHAVATAAATSEGVTAETLADVALLERETLTVLGVECSLTDRGESLLRGAERTWTYESRTRGYMLEVVVMYRERRDSGTERPWWMSVRVGRYGAVSASEIGATLAEVEAEVRDGFARCVRDATAFATECESFATDDPGYCQSCRGSGEGMADGTVCCECRGSGVELADEAPEGT